MSNITKLIIIIVFFLSIQSCKSSGKEELIIKYSAKEIDFSKYNFSIDFQDEIYNKNISFNANLEDVFKHDNKVYLLFRNEYIYFKLSSKKNSYSDFKMGDKVNAFALITNYDIYQMNGAKYYDDDGIWIGPTFVIKGELLEMIKR